PRRATMPMSGVSGTDEGLTTGASAGGPGRGVASDVVRRASLASGLATDAATEQQVTPGSTGSRKRILSLVAAAGVILLLLAAPFLIVPTPIPASPATPAVPTEDAPAPPAHSRDQPTVTSTFPAPGGPET